MTLLQCLLEPQSYYERDVQSAIEGLWDCLFTDYRLVERSKLRMPAEWQPDIVGYHPEEKVFLIIEIKGKPSSGSKKNAVKQVVGYAECFHTEYPDNPLRLLVIGPWKVKDAMEHIRYGGYEVGVIQIETVGRYLLYQAERVLLWCMENPFGWSRRKFRDIEIVVAELEACVGDKDTGSEGATSDADEE